MSKHTPGPWIIQPPNKTFTSIATMSGDSIADVWSLVRQDIPHEERHANARLIAVAPWLMESLIDILDTLIGDTEWAVSNTDADCNRIQVEIDTAYAVIAKARGR